MEVASFSSYYFYSSAYCTATVEQFQHSPRTVRSIPNFGKSIKGGKKKKKQAHEMGTNFVQRLIKIFYRDTLVISLKIPYQSTSHEVCVLYLSHLTFIEARHALKNKEVALKHNYSPHGSCGFQMWWEKRCSIGT